LALKIRELALGFTVSAIAALMLVKDVIVTYDKKTAYLEANLACN
jgi:hypothetical protein